MNHRTHTLVLILTLAALGCAGESMSPPKKLPPDSGPQGTWTPPDSGVVSGVPDGGIVPGAPDSGVHPDSGAAWPDAGFAPDTGAHYDGGTPPPPARCQPGRDGREGCGCASTIGASDTSFRQDSCRSGLLCIPYDVIADPDGATGAVQSCVRPCGADADCGPGRRCVDSGYAASTGAGRICVDRVAAYDEFCGFGRSHASPLPGTTLRTPGEQVGCSGNSACMVGAFSNLSPDEGVCLGLCEDNSDCGGAYPYCNPAVFNVDGANGSRSVGVCADERKTQGSICGTTNPAQSGFAFGCDTSAATPANTICVPVSGLTPDGQGICMTPCGGQLGACTATEPDGTPQTCGADFFSDGTGVCHSSCSNYPDTCAGGGERGLGRVCMAYLAGGSGDPIGMCVDRRGPVLAPATFDPYGNVTSQGDNCLAPGGSPGFTQCPQGTHCEIIDIQQSVGMCAAGCGPAGGSAGAAQCRAALGNPSAVCASVFQSGGQPVTAEGLCGAP